MCVELYIAQLVELYIATMVCIGHHYIHTMFSNSQELRFIVYPAHTHEHTYMYMYMYMCIHIHVHVHVQTHTGSLLDIIKHITEQGIKGGVLDEIVIATVLKGVLQGLEYFHGNSLIHRSVCRRC